MSKVIAAINLTVDGVYDHTAGMPDKEIHEHYTALLRNASAVLYGRITFQLMEFWRGLVAIPSGEKSMDDFAIAIDNTPKIVFSHTLQKSDWKTARVATRNLEAELEELKKSSTSKNKDIFVGSRSLIIQLMNLHLIDELQLCIHPVVAGSGSKLFENFHERVLLKFVHRKIFVGGAVILYYEPLWQ